ncbi:MAG: lipocalin family protein [Zoogloeaceae bacterium]|nr:lipocalin family protein [Zoogloeaceae bacterium]
MKLRLALILTLTLFLNATLAQSPQPLVPIAHLDLQRYSGDWYEIAKYPNRFQKHCVSDTSASYAPREDGRVDVVNRCRTADKGMDQAEGVARLTGGEGSATLKVRFAPAWLSWLPFVWGDYWVIELDDAYTLAAVSEPSREYLWILSRSPNPDPARVDALITRLGQRGFDPARIERSRQETP